MKGLLLLITFLNSFSAFAEGARQQRTCVNESSKKSVYLQLFAGPASYMNTAADVFAANVNGKDLQVVKAKATSTENLLSSSVSDDKTTTTLVTKIGLDLVLADDSTVSDDFVCTEIHYAP